MKAIKQKDSVLGALCAISCETLYGLNYIFTKQATGCSSEFALLGWRFFIAALAMSLCVRLGLIKIDLKGKPLKPLLLVALCSPCVYFIAETVGIRHTTASESGVLLACTGAEITYVMLLIGAALFILLAAAEAVLHEELAALIQLPFKEPAFLAAVVYQGIGCSIFAFFLSNLAIAKIGVNRTSSFIGIATVVSILAGALLLHEAFSAWQIIGAAVIVAGVYMANMTLPGMRRQNKTTA